jgi:hypothetical protein
MGAIPGKPCSNSVEGRPPKVEGLALDVRPSSLDVLCETTIKPPLSQLKTKSSQPSTNFLTCSPVPQSLDITSRL